MVGRANLAEHSDAWDREVFAQGYLHGLHRSEAKRPVECLRYNAGIAFEGAHTGGTGIGYAPTKQEATNTPPRPFRVSSEVPDMSEYRIHWLVRRVRALTCPTAAAQQACRRCELKLEHTNPIEALSNEQLVNMIEELKERIARRAAGSGAKLIEAVETTALPAPVEVPKPKRRNRVMAAADTAVLRRDET